MCAFLSPGVNVIKLKSHANTRSQGVIRCRAPELMSCKPNGNLSSRNIWLARFSVIYQTAGEAEQAADSYACKEFSTTLTETP